MPTNSFSIGHKAENRNNSHSPITVIKPTIADPLVKLMLVGSLFCGIFLGALLTILGFFNFLGNVVQKVFGRGKKKAGVDFRWLLQ